MYVFREEYRAPQGLFNQVLTDDCTGDVTSFVTATPAASMARIGLNRQALHLPTW